MTSRKDFAGHPAGHTGPIYGIDFNLDGSILASVGARDRTLRLWETASGTPLRRLVGNTSEVRWVVFSPDGNLLASAGGDKTVRLWDPSKWIAVRTLTGHTELIYSVTFSPDGDLLASAGSDNKVRLGLNGPSAKMPSQPSRARHAMDGVETHEDLAELRAAS
jgi:WD40 repeat protein